MDPRTLHVVVVGAGSMGHGIAHVLARAGASVAVHDVDGTVLGSVRERIAAGARALGGDPCGVERVAIATDLERAVGRADWVFEAAPEQLALKQELFARLDAAAPRACVLATNTSVLRVGEVGARAVRRERIVGTHWWNPPQLVPLVEVVAADATAADAVERTIALLEALGKKPVRVRRDVPGFVGNRLQHALWREAFALVDAGVCDPETIDAVVTEGFGLRLGVLGPMANADLVGLDLTLAIHEYLLPALSPPSQPSAGLRDRVAGGRLGSRTGGGWRSWEGRGADALRRRVFDHLAAATGAVRGAA